MRSKEEFKALVEERAAAQRKAAIAAARRRKMILSGAIPLVLIIAIALPAIGLFTLPAGMAEDGNATMAGNNGAENRCPLADETAPNGTSPEFVYPNYDGAGDDAVDNEDYDPSKPTPDLTGATGGMAPPPEETEPDLMPPPSYSPSDPYADITADSPADLLSELRKDTGGLSEESVALLTALLPSDLLTLPDGRAPFCALYHLHDGYFMLKLTWSGENAFRYTLLFDDTPFFTEEWLQENYQPVEAEIPLYRHPSADNEFYRACLSNLLLAEIEFSKDHTDITATLTHLIELCKEFCVAP
ncbi:MAG: hypothetical protein IJX76_00795 [Clostridia bacterium]|nr:hypothetical protein [Clostridia bacterium]